MSDHPTKLSPFQSVREPAYQASWEKFVTFYEPLVRSHCRHRGLQEADVDDVTQDVFCTLVSAIRRLNHSPDRERFRGWLIQVTRSKLRGFFAARRRRFRIARESAPHGSLADRPSPKPPRGSKHAPLFGLVQRAAKQVRRDLKESNWKAFWRTVVRGETTREVAASLGMTPRAVYTAKCLVADRIGTAVQRLCESA